jgi:putative restriction endonuclease
MNLDDLREPNEFLEQIRSMKLHRSSSLGSALKKPLLLLLLVSRIENDRVEENRFHYDDIETKLSQLIREHGGRPTDAGPRPEQPFSHLRSSPFWVLKTERDYAPGTTVLVSDLRRRESYGAFEPKVFRLLRSSAEVRAQVVDSVLNEWWPETLHGDIREDLGLDRLDSCRRPQRDQQFTIDVLENFRYSCALCGFHGLLNGQATGIDAGHIHWRAHSGPDTVENGIALCKLHHWAFDKGILGINEANHICIADAFVTQQDGGLPLESLVNRCLAVQPRNKPVGSRFLEWHRNNVYLGSAE